MINASASTGQTTAHQAWCDPAEHALSSSAFVDDRGNPIDSGCVGAAIEPFGADELGGWWHQDDDGQPEFIVDRGFDVTLSTGVIRLLDQMLNTPEGTEQLRQLAGGAVNALGSAAA